MPRRPVIPRTGANEMTTAEARIISDRIKTPTWRNTATQPDASQSDAQRQEPADPTTNSATCAAVRNPERRRSPDPESAYVAPATKSPGGSRQQYGPKKTVFAIRSALRTFPGLETSAHYYESQESSFSARNFRPRIPNVVATGPRSYPHSPSTSPNIAPIAYLRRHTAAHPRHAKHATIVRNVDCPRIPPQLR